MKCKHHLHVSPPSTFYLYCPPFHIDQKYLIEIHNTRRLGMYGIFESTKNTNLTKDDVRIDVEYYRGAIAKMIIYFF